MDSVAERLAGFGAYFAADSHAADAVPVAPWRPMSELLEDATVVSGRVEGVRGFLAAAGDVPVESIPLRAAASVMHLGLAARVLGPGYAAAVLGLDLPAYGLRDLRWQPAPGSTFALSIAGLDDAAEAPGARLRLEPAVTELCEIMRPFRLSPRILRGNLASALNGARAALSNAAPRLADRAGEELDRLLESPLLAETWRIADGRFQRRSCCLIYQAAPNGRGPVCGDCVLLRPLSSL